MAGSFIEFQLPYLQLEYLQCTCIFYTFLDEVKPRGPEFSIHCKFSSLAASALSANSSMKMEEVEEEEGFF